MLEGKCHTLQRGFLIGEFGTMIGLHPRTYKIYIHDPFYFLTSYKPPNFPGLVIKRNMKTSSTILCLSVPEHMT